MPNAPQRVSVVNEGGILGVSRPVQLQSHFARLNIPYRTTQIVAITPIRIQ